MQDFKGAKKIYDSVEIPEELKDVVADTIHKMSEGKVMSMKKKNNYLTQVAGVAACVVVGVTITLNTSETFAKTMEEIPVIGAVARVLTIRNYEKVDEDKTLTIRVPEIQSVGNGGKEELIQDVNQTINEVIDDYTKEAEKHIQEYKEAFIATGGTEKEFTEKGIKVDVNYEVKMQTDKVVSLVLTANENWCMAYGVQYFYNLNLESGKIISLKDLLGEDYIEVANTSIKRQMEERMKTDSNLIYWDGEMDGFKTINQETKFYINKEGNPVVVFEKYEVAPGFMGIQEFEIKD